VRRLAGPKGASPARQPGSIRRTASVDIHWPGVPTESVRVEGRARDLLTPVSGDPAVLGEDALTARIDAESRVITAISAEPRRDLSLVVALPGARFRDHLAAILPEEQDAGTPLFLLLDELPGCALIGRFAVSQWLPSPVASSLMDPGPRRDVTDVCIGLRRPSTPKRVPSRKVDEPFPAERPWLYGVVSCARSGRRRIWSVHGRWSTTTGGWLATRPVQHGSGSQCC